MATDEIAISADRDVTLPLVNLLTGRGFVTGKSGSGKSNSVNVIVEETLDLGRPLLIVDTDGEYWGLKEQYSMLHLGNDDRCDATVTAADADTIVDVALLQGVPVILDISGFLREEDAEELVHRVVKRLFQREKDYREPFLLIVEEVHEYIPEQGGLSDAGETLIQVAKRGRKHGLGFLGVSQRPASVDKNVITQCDWITWHRLTWKNDTDVVRTLLGADAAEQVEELDPGQALLMTDWDERVRDVQFRKKRTFDAGQTPGFDEFDPPELVPVEADILERFGVDGDGATGDPPDDAEADHEEDAALEAPERDDPEDAVSEGESKGEDETADPEPLADTPDEDAVPAPDTDDEPEVLQTEPVDTGGTGATLDRAGSDGGARSPRPATPTSGRSNRRRRRSPPPDQPAIVEFGQLVIHLSRTVGGTVGRGAAGVGRALGGRLGAWFERGNVSEEDLVVVGWLVLVVAFIGTLAVLLALTV